MLLVTAEQMRKIDQVMIEEVGVPAVALMELAGVAVADVVAAKLAAGRERIDIVAGKGHNGADGLAAARHLLARGYDVRVWLAYGESSLAALTSAQLRSYRALGGALAGAEDDLSDSDLIVDALLGTGSRLPLAGAVKLFAMAMAKAGKRVIAVDLPTGLDADTGLLDDVAIRAEATVTYGFGKPGLYQLPGRQHAGDVVIAGLSMPDALAVGAGAKTFLVTAPDCAKRYRVRAVDSHKGTFGRLGVVAGSDGMYGAARLAVQGAYRAGAGLVYYFAPDSLNAAVCQSFPQETVIRRHPGADDSWNAERVRSCAKFLGAVSSGLCGPGLGPQFVRLASEQPGALLPFAEADLPLVLDADFLQALARLPEEGLADFFLRRRQATVITPHPKEFSALTGLSVQEVQSDRVRHAAEFAERYGVYVVLKGAATVTAAPDGAAFINTTGNSGLASGGTGDVLAGLAAGLLASGYAALDAALLAVYAHGLAADLACAGTETEESLVASDLLQWIGRAFRQISRAMDKVTGALT